MPSISNFCANIGCECANPGPEGPAGPPGPVDIRYHTEDGADVGDPGLSSTHIYTFPAPAGRRLISGSYRFRSGAAPGRGAPEPLPHPDVNLTSALVAADGSYYELRFDLAGSVMLDVTVVSVPLP